MPELAPLHITLPLTLEGSVVRLEPIRCDHAGLFLEIAKNDLEDIFRWSEPGATRPQALSAFHVGGAVIDGADVDQYAFRGPDSDWQVWIQKGDQPLPRKLVIADRTDPARPAYSARLTWTVNPTLTPADFTFQPGPDVKQIRLTTSGQ